MSQKKQKKRRTKRYSGANAKVQAPIVTRVSAEELSPWQEWWRTYGRLARFIAIILAIIALLALLVIGIIGILAG